MTAKNCTLLLPVLAIFLTSPVHALIISEDIRPPLAGTEFSLEMKPAETGSTLFIIKRKLSHAPESGKVHRRWVHSASLTVYGDGGMVGRFPVHASTDDEGNLVYRFTLDDQYARKSQFVLSDSIEPQRLVLDDVQWLNFARPQVLKAPAPKRRHLLPSGGYRYSFRLIDFIEPSAYPSGPANTGFEHPELEVTQRDGTNRP